MESPRECTHICDNIYAIGGEEFEVEIEERSVRVSRLNNLGRHVRKSHPGLAIVRKVRKSRGRMSVSPKEVCPVCGFCFSVLRKHVKICV